MLFVLLNNFDFIDGTPKHVPTTRVHPKIPLKNGNKKFLPKP